ncbi:MAG: flagellar biosynthesis anti-sigma factor FlgM [Candidatus Margulisbacteria bacterium]|nr:flagellar biosynthesis anti-sigma factor FlgM [Candidatus Margulisiibacteriota bacterium]
MRILESGAFDEIKKTLLPKQERKVQEQGSDAVAENKVAAENKRAFELVFNDKSFDIDLKKIEQIKKDIAEGNYTVDSTKIAEEMLKSEQRGESSMGLFKS